MKSDCDSVPDLPKMAIFFTATLMVAPVVFTVADGVIRSVFEMDGRLPVILGMLIAALWVAAAGYRIGTSPDYQSSNPYSERLFHFWQIVVLVLIFGFAFLMGKQQSPVLVWFAVVVEFTLVAFYFSFIGYGIVLKQRLGASAYAGLFFVICSAAYAVWNAQK